ncbi:hypothetical protein VTK73DRAFT_7250 [Phialemonium thermophilum]|uniref:Polysaccharide export protein n=1 Tax=Phialemonium thermophilum TaxID=223376 RepID=A0ABR3XTP1_9PEZI
MLLYFRLLRRLHFYYRPVLVALVVFFLLDALLVINSRPTTRVSPIVSRPNALHTTKSPAQNTTVFIVSVHRNTGAILRAAWNDAIMQLVSLLGPENVHFSAVEGGSQDYTKAALMELKGMLDSVGVSNTISLGMTVWEQLAELETRPDPKREREAGWIWNDHDARYDLRRIPYLSKVRNQAMEPLKQLERAGRKFDKVLWVNDVVFDAEDFVTLLHTRDGRYAAACSMDFKVYPYYYDTFALRDDLGRKTASYYWPWFMSDSSRASVRHGDPVKVFSCWNGMVVFDAEPFYSEPPLRFRGVDDSLADLHLEASECCLIHADNVLTSEPDKGVWLNPNVRVAYSVPTYRQVKRDRFPGAVAAVFGAWANRWSRAKGVMQYSLETQTVRTRLNKWKAETPPGELTRMEVGEPCLINEMQIMWQNGWRHL